MKSSGIGSRGRDRFRKYSNATFRCQRAGGRNCKIVSTFCADGVTRVMPKPSGGASSKALSEKFGSYMRTLSEVQPQILRLHHPQTEVRLGPRSLRMTSEFIWMTSKSFRIKSESCGLFGFLAEGGEEVVAAGVGHCAAIAEDAHPEEDCPDGEYEEDAGGDERQLEEPAKREDSGADDDDG